MDGGQVKQWVAEVTQVAQFELQFKQDPEDKYLPIAQDLIKWQNSLKIIYLN